jgi:hypothetical protein
MPIPRGDEIFLDGTPVSGVNEVQRITITGNPTGGTFTLTWNGQTTAAMFFNAMATQVQVALEALSNIGVGEVACAGGQLPTNFVEVAFQNRLGGLDQPQMTASSAGLTGGTTPTVTITTPTAGVRGSYRGAAFGAILLDLIDGIIYEQTSTSAATPTWSELELD